MTPKVKTNILSRSSEVRNCIKTRSCQCEFADLPLGLQVQGGQFLEELNSLVEDVVHYSIYYCETKLRNEVQRDFQTTAC